MTSSNIVLTCRKPGKLTSSLIEYWRDNALAPIIKNKDYLLILDLWGAQRAITIYKVLTNAKGFEIQKKPTGMIQPPDVCFNRLYNMIERKIYEYVRLYCININPSPRNNGFKMNSLIHNRLSSKEFNAMIKYPWCKAGYLTVYPGNFKNVKQICFAWNDRNCSAYMCHDITFICCSKPLCLNHFFG